MDRRSTVVPDTTRFGPVCVSVAGAGGTHGDGFDDIVVGRVDSNNGTAVYLGAAMGVDTVPVTLTGAASGLDFGGSVE